MTITIPPRLRVFTRVLLAFAGGYYLSVGAAALLGVLLALASGGMRSDAFFAAGMSSSLIFCGVLLWVFSERRLWVVAAWVIVGAALCFAAAAALEPHIKLPAPVR